MRTSVKMSGLCSSRNLRSASSPSAAVTTCAPIRSMALARDFRTMGSSSTTMTGPVRCTALSARSADSWGSASASQPRAPALVVLSRFMRSPPPLSPSPLCPHARARFTPISSASVHGPRPSEQLRCHIGAGRNIAPGRRKRSAAGGAERDQVGKILPGGTRPAGGTGQFLSGGRRGPTTPSRRAWSGAFASRCRGSRRPSSCCRSPWRAHGGYARDRARRGTPPASASAAGFRAYSAWARNAAGGGAGAATASKNSSGSWAAVMCVVRAQDHQPLDEVPQLADIARPRVPQEQRPRPRA